MKKKIQQCVLLTDFWILKIIAVIPRGLSKHTIKAIKTINFTVVVGRKMTNFCRKLL